MNLVDIFFWIVVVGIGVIAFVLTVKNRVVHQARREALIRKLFPGLNDEEVKEVIKLIERG